MRKVRNAFLFLIVCHVLCWVSMIYVVAATDVDIKASITTAANSAEISNICLQANNKVSVNILSYTSTQESGLLQFDNVAYSKLDSEDKKEFMGAALSATTKTGLNAKTKNSVYNFIASQDSVVTNSMKYLQVNANADFVEAKKYFDPWSSVVGTVIGVLCVLIFMCAAISVLFDMGYLVLPCVQAILERGDDNTKPFGVSREAYSSLRDAERDTEYKNVLAIYLKRRIGLIFAMALCISYIISGKIYDVIIFLIDSY